ncbi:MAG: uroporphyrinogen decarboxylase family protein [Candidatus Freyarchaeota archaeon]
MSSVLERVLVTMSFKEPEWVPVILFPEWDFLADLYGVPLKKLLDDPMLQIEAGEKMRERFPDAFIATSVWVPYAHASGFGCVLSEPEDEIPGVKEVAVKSPEDIDALEIPDPYSDGLMPKYLEYLKVQQEVRGSTGVGDFGPVELACEIMGYTNFLKLMAQNPEYAHKLLDIMVKSCTNWFNALIDVIGGSAMFVLVSDHTTGFLRAKQCEEFFTPYLKRFIDSIRSKVSIFLYHNENYAAHVLDQIAQLGINIFHCGEIGDLETAKKETYGKYTLMGNIHPRDVLLRGTPKLVEGTCKEVIQKLGPGGGFILSVGGGVSRNIPLEHIDILIECAKKYGTPPIQTS